MHGADMAGADLQLLQRVADDKDSAVTSRYLHPDHPGCARVGLTYSCRWAQSGSIPALRLVKE